MAGIEVSDVGREDGIGDGLSMGVNSGVGVGSIEGIAVRVTVVESKPDVLPGN